MSTLLTPPNRTPVTDREFNNFRESPQHGEMYPAHAVVVENDITDPIPVNVVDGEPGIPIYYTAEAATTPAVEQELLNIVVGVGIILDIYSSKVVTRVHGKFRVTLDGALIGSGRTGPSLGDLSQFDWSPRRSVPTGSNLKVLFTSLSGTPISEVEAYLNGSERSSP